jgi:hypothetical protein
MNGPSRFWRGLFNLDRTESRQGDVVLHARHPVLSDLAEMLTGPGFALPQGQPVRVMVGVHGFARRILPGGLRIGMQTEQLADATGKPLWGARAVAGPGRGLGRQLRRHAALIDLAPENRPAYASLGEAALRRVVFGPFLFPDIPPAFEPGTGADLVFFGALNDRRRALLRAIAERRPVKILPEGTHGAALRAAIAPAAGVLNLHFADGIYTEGPRLLVALLAGKPVFSEQLAPPLACGTDYLTPEEIASADRRAAVFAAFRDGFARRHRFSEALGHAIARAAD